MLLKRFFVRGMRKSQLKDSERIRRNAIETAGVIPWFG